VGVWQRKGNTEDLSKGMNITEEPLAKRKEKNEVLDEPVLNSVSSIRSTFGFIFERRSFRYF